MFECYSFRVNTRGYQDRQLRMQETSTQFSQNGETYSFPDGFTLFDAEQEVGRLPLDEIEICHDHENCFISLPDMFRLELHSTTVVVLLDEQKFCAALHSSAAAVLQAYRVLPILLHRFSDLHNSPLAAVAETIEQADAVLSRQQKHLISAMSALPSERLIAESLALRIGNTSFWADLGQNCIVEKPNLRVCPLKCRGGLVVAPPGFGRKRAVLAAALASAQPLPSEREQESLLCHLPIGVICAPAEIQQWLDEAAALSATALAIPDLATVAMLTVEIFRRSPVVIISSKVIESSGLWVCPAEFRDARFRRCDLLMHMRRLGRLESSSPMLDLVYWKWLIFAESINPLLTKTFRADQRWALLPGSNLLQLHRAWELLQAECEADFPLKAFAANFGLDWAPSAEQLPKLERQPMLVELSSPAKAYLLQNGRSSDAVCGPIKSRKMLCKPEKVCSTILASNAAHLKKLDAYARKLRAQEKLWHRELQREEEPPEWDSTFLGDWNTVREHIVQSELSHVEASLKLIAKTHQLFAHVEQHHLEATLADQCPVCGDNNETVFRCGHGACWACVFTMFSNKTQIKCPQCRCSLVRADVWTVELTQGQSKFQVLEKLLESTAKPCLILMESNSGCKAAMRALAQFALKPISEPIAEEIYIGRYSTLANRHLQLKHLILVQPFKSCEPIVQHIGNPNQECLITTLLYKGFETAV